MEGKYDFYYEGSFITGKSHVQEERGLIVVYILNGKHRQVVTCYYRHIDRFNKLK